jgi:tetratricopeptide (TPR) repeat protein
LDRNLADAHAFIGEARTYMGRAAEAEAHINEAFRLSPRDIFAFNWLLLIGYAKLQLNADAEAVSCFRRSIEANRNYPATHFALAAALVLLGSLDEARAAAKAGLALDQSFTIRRYRNGAPSDNPTYLASRERVYEGIRMAGVPEGGRVKSGHRPTKEFKIRASVQWQTIVPLPSLRPRATLANIVSSQKSRCSRFC